MHLPGSILILAGRRGAGQRGASGSYIVPAGIHKIKHVIIVMQENRSFDTYFGIYPGADGIPMKDGTPTVCVPNPAATRTAAADGRPAPPGRRRQGGRGDSLAALTVKLAIYLAAGEER